jgi:hypothetical protein
MNDRFTISGEGQRGPACRGVCFDTRPASALDCLAANKDGEWRKIQTIDGVSAVGGTREGMPRLFVHERR